MSLPNGAPGGARNVSHSREEIDAVVAGRRARAQQARTVRAARRARPGPLRRLLSRILGRS